MAHLVIYYSHFLEFPQMDAKNLWQIFQNCQTLHRVAVQSPVVFSVHGSINLFGHMSLPQLKVVHWLLNKILVSSYL